MSTLVPTARFVHMSYCSNDEEADEQEGGLQRLTLSRKGTLKILQACCQPCDIFFVWRTEYPIDPSICVSYAWAINFLSVC